MPVGGVLFTMPSILENLYLAGTLWLQQHEAVYADAVLPWSTNYVVGFEKNY